MIYKTYTDGGEVRSWKGVGNERVGLLLYDTSIPLEHSSLTLTSDGGVCVFASPPLYDDPEVCMVKNWNREIPQLAKRQGSRHAFIGGREKVEKLGANPKYAECG